MTPGRAAVAALAVLLLFAACQDSTRPGPSEPDLSLVTLTHVCGERFDLGNGNLVDVTVRYTVAGSAESGDLTLASGARPSPGPSWPCTFMCCPMADVLSRGRLGDPEPSVARIIRIRQRAR